MLLQEQGQQLEVVAAVAVVGNNLCECTVAASGAVVVAVAAAVVAEQ